MLRAESKEEYIKFDGNSMKKFCEWAIKTKAVGARKGWVKTLTKNLVIDWKGADDMGKKAVMMIDLAYHHLVMYRQTFYYVQAEQDENGMPGKCGKSYVGGMQMCPKLTW